MDPRTTLRFPLLPWIAALPLLLLALTAGTSLSYAGAPAPQAWDRLAPPPPFTAAAEEEAGNPMATGAYEREYWWWFQRAYPSGRIPANAEYNALMRARAARERA